MSKKEKVKIDRKALLPVEVNEIFNAFTDKKDPLEKLKLGKVQMFYFIFNFFRNEEEFPADTTTKNWLELKMDKLFFFSRNTPHSPDFGTREISNKLQIYFKKFSFEIDDPFPILQDKDKTCKDLINHCFDTQNPNIGD